MKEILKHLSKLSEIWFADGADWPTIESSKRWFMSNAEFDKQLIDNFAGLPERVAEFGSASFVADDRTAAAAVVALDQLPRNLHRGSAHAFAFDEDAMELTRALITANRLEKLWPAERLFVLMPYQHVEDLEMQKEGLTHFEQVITDSPAEHKEMVKGTYDYAVKHFEIIEKFGRFPHRNDALGRASTQAELDYLADGGERFGQ